MASKSYFVNLVLALLVLSLEYNGCAFPDLLQILIDSNFDFNAAEQALRIYVKNVNAIVLIIGSALNFMGGNNV